MSANQNRYIYDEQPTADNKLYYKKQGFLVAKGLISNGEVEELNREALEIFRGNRGDVTGIQKYDREVADLEILNNHIAIHFPHKISEVILHYVKHKKIIEILTGIISLNVKCMQSMLFIKSPGMKGQSWHQDEYFIPTRDRSLTGVWIALDKALIENGCLWVIPGSHTKGIIHRRIPNSSDEYGDEENCDLDAYDEKKEAVAVEVDKGDVIFFNGYLLHSSLKNKSKNMLRRALVNHYMSAESLLPWDWDGNLPMSEDMRDIVMVAGKDPYHYKGLEDLTKPFLREKRLRAKRSY